MRRAFQAAITTRRFASREKEDDKDLLSRRSVRRAPPLFRAMQLGAGKTNRAVRLALETGVALARHFLVLHLLSGHGHEHHSAFASPLLFGCFIATHLVLMCVFELFP